MKPHHHYNVQYFAAVGSNENKREMGGLIDAMPMPSAQMYYFITRNLFLFKYLIEQKTEKDFIIK